MDFVEKLGAYAQLLVEFGLNVQPGQLVGITAEGYHQRLVQLIARECYRAGARYVAVEYSDPHILKTRLEFAAEETLEFVPDWERARGEELVDQRGAHLAILGFEEPELLKGVDPDKINTVRKGRYRAYRRFYEEGIDGGHLQWCVAAAPTKKWAARIYPEHPAKIAEAKLWEDIFLFCRITDHQFRNRWERHRTKLEARAKRLTSLQLRRLIFKGPGTALQLGLSPFARFVGGAETTRNGVIFDPNIPTEECFTTPDWRMTEGQVAITRPVFVNGILVDGLCLTFASGELTSFEARSGSEAFAAFLSSDRGARRVGEVALVGIDSPIFCTKRVYEEVLLDENAACHIALGSGYRSGLSSPKTQDFSSFYVEAGCNESSVHTDFMISSEQVDVEGVNSSGRVLPLLRKGQWVESFITADEPPLGCV